MKSIETTPYGKLADGTKIELYTLTNTNGARAGIITYGGIVTTLEMPDRNGRMGDVTLGFDNLDDYISRSPYFGCLIGRCGNRMAKGRFTLDGKQYSVAVNDGENHLHGGIRGFDKQVWSATPVPNNPDGPALEMKYVSRDMEEGYPGTLSVKAVYTLTNTNALKVEFTASTDRKTICNLTHHAYFNLNECSSDILDHEIKIEGSRYTPVDRGLIPTGEIAGTKGTPLDFTTPCAIGKRISHDFEQLKLGGGYDHNWVMDRQDGKVNLQATVYDPASGRVLETLSNQPGVQFYSGNFLDGSLKGKRGIPYKHRYGICLEPQHYPNSANTPGFPSIELTPGKTYRNTIIYSFSTK